jgi:hypothetical protein
MENDGCRSGPAAARVATQPPERESYPSFATGIARMLNPPST